MKKFVILCLLLSGCSPSSPPKYSTYFVDPSTLPECSSKVLKTKEEYVTFETNQRDILYVATYGHFQCLYRYKAKKN